MNNTEQVDIFSQRGAAFLSWKYVLTSGLEDSTAVYTAKLAYTESKLPQNELDILKNVATGMNLTLPTAA